MNIKDMEDLIMMYEAYQKQEKVYNLLYGDLELESNRLFGIGYDDGIFGVFSRIENIIYRNSKLTKEETSKILSDKNLFAENKAERILNSES